MLKRKTIWALLAAGMTVASTGVVSAQWIDRETLTRMMFSAAGNRVAKSPPTASKAGRHGLNSLVGSWIETATFPPETGRSPLKSLISIHDDGTLTANDQGSVITEPPPEGPPPGVTTTGVGIWTRLKNRTFAYTQLNLLSDLSGNLVGYLKVRGRYTLDVSGNEYTGKSFFEVFDVGGNTLVDGSVTNEGERIQLELPPKD